MTNIAGREFSAQTMSGRKYVYEYPGLLQAVVDSSGFEAGHSDVIPLPDKLYLQYGELVLNASPNKRFYPGMLLTLSGDNNATKGYAVVIRYTAPSGTLTLSIQGYSGAVIFGPFLRLEVSVNGANVKTTGPLGLFQGGTGYNNIAEVFLAREFNSPEIYAEEIRDDFIEAINSITPSPYLVLVKSGAARFYSYPETGLVSSFNPENRAGFLALEVSAELDQIVLKRGSGHRNLLINEPSRSATHAFHFYIGTLSDGTNRYRLRLGLSANSSTPELIGDGGGIVLTYVDNENSGRFSITYGKDGSTISTGAVGGAVTIGWHTLTIAGYGDASDIYIDGILGASLTSADLYGTGDSNVFSPCFSLEKTLGFSGILVILDGYFSNQPVTR